jgi:hypothetical protein
VEEYSADNYDFERRDNYGSVAVIWVAPKKNIAPEDKHPVATQLVDKGEELKTAGILTNYIWRSIRDKRGVPTSYRGLIITLHSDKNARFEEIMRCHLADITPRRPGHDI